MTKWLVQYAPRFEADLDEPTVNGREIPRFRVFPKGESERWITETNTDLPRDVQEEFALIIADNLTKYFLT